MDTIEKLKQYLKTRIHENPDKYYEVTLWEDETNAVCQDISASIHFILYECTDEEFYYLGEVFDDIMERTRSVEFLNCLRERVQRVEDPRWKAELLEDIRTAAEYVDA